MLIAGDIGRIGLTRIGEQLAFSQAAGQFRVRGNRREIETRLQLVGEAMAEVGIDIANNSPKVLTPERSRCA